MVLAWASLIVGVVAFIFAYIWYRQTASKRAMDKVVQEVGDIKQAVSHPSVPAVPPAMLWNIPLPRNLNFTGRGDLLKVLHDRLHSGRSTTPTNTAAVHGLGGIGKTQLALEYCFRHRQEYKYIWWVRAERTESLVGDLAALGLGLNLPPQPDEQAMVARTVHWLDGHEGWLLVFDNVQTPDDVLPYLPKAGVGHVILTTRHSDWSGTAEEIRVDVLPLDKAIAFLFRRAGRRDKDGAERLARELGCLPLALDQAGTYVRQSGLTFDGYIELYRRQRSELMRRGALDKTRYPETVATTWNISFDRATAECAASAEVLGILAFLAAESVPKSLLEAPDADRVIQADAVSVLQKYSLVTVKDEGLWVHRLVQAAVRDRLSPEQARRMVATALERLAVMFPLDSEDIRTWPECTRLLPHALSVLRFRDDYAIETRQAGELLANVGNYFWARAANREAERMLSQAVTVLEKVLGGEHPDTVAALNNLALLYQSMGRLAEAEPLAKRALATAEKVLGKDHPDVASQLTNLAGLYRATGRLAEAEPLAERALDIRQQKLGPDDPYVAQSLNNLGWLYSATGRLGEAERMYRRALEIRERKLGPGHPDVVQSLNNLAAVYRDTGRSKEAEDLFAQALDIFKRTLGDEHPFTKKTQRNLDTIRGAPGNDPQLVAR